MRYERVREEIANGDLLFFRGRMLHSRIIQRWTRSVYSHVGIAHWIRSDGCRRLAVVEAMEGRGVQLFPLSEYLRRGNHVDWFAITDPSISRDKVVAWAMKRWGRDYASPRQMLRSFVTLPLANWLGLPTMIDRDRYFCSWVAAESLKNGGFNPPADDAIPRPECASPGDVALFPCLQRRGTLVLERKAAA